MHRRVIAATALLFLIGAAKPRAVRAPGTPVELSATRSFEITDKGIVGSFTLDRVLTQLVARSNASVTPQQLLRQMFDTQNPRPGLAEVNAPHCDDTMMGGVPSFNGFPRRCPTPEGKYAAVPYAPDDYFTIGIANRFDLTPPDGANCGQYRLVFARRESDPLQQNRLHLIFEAVLPNPTPSAGLAGCRAVAQFWADLSAVESMDERRARIERFFFNGLDGFPPVIDAANFDSPGGIRTLQQANNTAATRRFYQFRLVREGGTLRFVPDVLENMPFGLLFDATNDTPLARAFRDEFIRQIPTLAIGDLNLFHMKIPNEYLMVESNPIDSPAAFGYDLPFNAAKSSPQGAAFRTRIQTELDRIGSKVTIDQLILRTEHQTCTGCHGFNGLNLGEGVKLDQEPVFFGLQMISEDVLSDGEAGPLSRYGLDPTLEKQFIPNRMEILREFLRSGKAPVHSE